MEPHPATMDCVSINDVANDLNTPGHVSCERPDDCCLCRSIRCGNQAEPCDAIQFGDNAAFGVQDIVVVGSGANAMIDCWG